MPTLHELIQDTLATGRMQHHFQPIWGTSNGKLLGFEALARFPGHPPDEVFQAADNAGIGVHLDRLSVRESLRTGQALPGLLFVNINPNHLGQSEGPFGSIGTAIATFRSRRALVLEITEQKVVAQSAVEVGIARMHRRFLQLALDDAGTGNSDANRLKWIQPGFVKIAQPVIDAWHRGNPSALLRWIRLAQQVDAEIIAEGIEDIALIEPLAELGIHYVQGYAVGRPNTVEFWLEELGSREDAELEAAVDLFTPPQWTRPGPAQPPLLNVTEIGDIMYSLWPYPAIIVDGANRVVGMNLRAERHLATSLEQIALRPAEEVLGLAADEPGMTHVSAVLPGEMPVGSTHQQRVSIHRTDGRDVTALLTLVGIRIGNRPAPYKLITLMPNSEDSTLVSLLGKDPLSGLPTRAWWERERESWQFSHGAVIFLDMDGLKQVNDLFGHHEGDRLLADAGRIIHRLTESEGAAAVRYGGDEFLVVLKNKTAEEAADVARNIAAQFASFESIASRIPATLSYGAAEFGVGQLEQAIAQADQHLYEHKGLLLSTQSGSRLVLTTQGRRALWLPIGEEHSEQVSLDRLVQHGDDRPLRRAVTEFIQPQPGLAVVEVNAGRGQIGFLGDLVERLGPGAQYLAADHSGAYLRRLHQQWRETGHNARVHFLRTMPDQLPIVSQSADLSLIAFSLPEDAESTLRELARITRAKGQVAVALLDSVELSSALTQIWDPAARPQATITPDEVLRTASRLGLRTLRMGQFHGELAFATLTDLSVWLGSLELEAHHLIYLQNPAEFNQRRDFRIAYSACFLLFECPEP